MHILRKVNAETQTLLFYMPTTDEIVDVIGQSKVITKLDLTKVFLQVKMNVSDKEKTTFTCHRGKFQYKRMPFGVKNAPAVFQGTVDEALKDCRDCSRTYINDIIVFSSTWSDHLIHLRKVLNALRRAGLHANPSKCEWRGAFVNYLGHVVGSGVLAVPKHRITALANFPMPQTKKGLRSFLGVISYYRKFVSGIANFTAPLTPSTNKAAPARVQWTREMEVSFSELKISVSVLNVPSPDDSFVPCVDASVLGIGGVLCILRNEEEVSVAFYSRQTKNAERSYSATELENLALLCTIQHFSHYLFGKHFIIYTDHKALLSLMNSVHLNRRLHRISLCIYLSLSLHRVGERTMRKHMHTNTQNMEYRTSDLEHRTLNMVHLNIASS